MTEYVAEQPKVSKRNRKERKQFPGRYFGPVLNSIGLDRQKQIDSHEWTGFLNPSGELKWDMCMDEVYDRLCKPLTDIDETGELLMFLGTAMHKAFEKQSLKIPDFHHECHVPVRFKAWQERSRPEVVGQWDAAGYRFKLDSVIAGPDIVDLKTSYMDPNKWPDFSELKLPKEKDTVQIMLYAIALEELGYVERVREMGLCYLNVTNHFLVRGVLQATEKWWDLDDRLRYDAKLLIYRMARHRRFNLLGKRESCDYERCRKHGNEQADTYMRIKGKTKHRGRDTND